MEYQLISCLSETNYNLLEDNCKKKTRMYNFAIFYYIMNKSVRNDLKFSQ